MRAIQHPHDQRTVSASSTKPGQTTPSAVAEEAEQQRREEAAEAAHRADQSGDRAGLAGKVLRHELEHRAVAEPEQRRAAERADRERAASTAT